MKMVAWSSQRYHELCGGSTYLTVDGREIQVVEVAQVPDDFIWPCKLTTESNFHADDEFGVGSVPLTIAWGDLVYEGEVTKCLKPNEFYELDDDSFGNYDDDDTH